MKIGRIVGVGGLQRGLLVLPGRVGKVPSHRRRSCDGTLFDPDFSGAIFQNV
jgi:hypothetical protein